MFFFHIRYCTLVGIDISPRGLSIDNGLFCFQLATTKEYRLVLLRTGIHILIIAKEDLPITLKAFAAISAQPLQQNLPQSTIQVVELPT